MKNKPQQWVHGYDGWKWSKDCECYYHSNFHEPPNSYCLGDRYIYCHFGFDSYEIIWMGSSSDNWNGRSFGFDLAEAIRWVQSTEYPELGCKLWSKLDPIEDYEI